VGDEVIVARARSALQGRDDLAGPFSVGWACTDRELDAIDKAPKALWQNGIPGLRIIARDEPLHPKYLKRASDREKTRGRRYQLIAVNAATGQVAWLDARHRSHVHVKDDVKQTKAIGMNRWPSQHWKINVAWMAVVALAGSLLAAFRHLGLPPGHLRKASIQTLRFRIFEVPGRITYGQRKTWLHLPTDWPWTPDLTTTWQTIKTLPIPT